jgi:hypothetical protein
VRCVCVDESQKFGPLEEVAIFRRSEALREAYSPGILQFWYILIDMHVILFYAEFEDGSFISVLKNWVSRYKFWGLKAKKPYVLEGHTRPILI